MAHPQPERSELHPTIGDPQPILSLADAHAGASPDAVWLTDCAWCGRVRIGGRWIDEPHTLALVASFGTVPKRTHGICPACFDAVSREADDWRRRKAS